MSAVAVDAAPAFAADRNADVRRTVPWSPFAYVARQLRRCVADLIAAADPGPAPVVLDYGADDAPYRRHLPAGADYRSADLAGNPRADVEIRPDGSLPIADGTVDLVLSTQVLEHVDDPALYLSECARVLRPGGSLVLTTHGIMYIHRDPQDYWRWTCDGLEKIVGQAGLEVERSEGVLGLVPAGLQLVQVGLARKLPRFVLAPLFLLFQALIAATDQGYTAGGRRQFGLVIGVLARKPGVAA
ncbi:MAG TPA: methyltransferase domain-containing protein [Iamia sp.]|nr:methyltransferase domain-containing protein [Iamia sp.]